MSPEFAAALVKVQGQLEGAKKDTANPFHKSKYADLSSCWDACREALQNNNVAVLQLPANSWEGCLEPIPNGSVGLATVLVYGPTGEQVSSFYNLPLKDPTNPQALGSAITYMRRYALCAALGICPEDDDGNSAAGKEKPRKELPSVSKVASEGAFESEWKAAKTIDEMKAVYTKVKHSNMDEAKKQTLLARYADTIKGQMAVEANTPPGKIDV